MTGANSGASPNLKNGYTMIANELLEALFRMPLSARAKDVLLAIIRETYGFHVKHWPISESRLAEITALDRGNVHRALCELEEKKVITCLGTASGLGLVREKGKRGFDPRAKVWAIQGDYLQWSGCRQVAVRETGMLLSEGQRSCYQRDSNLASHKEKERKVKKESDTKSPPPKKKRGPTSSKKKRKRDARLDHSGMKIYRALAHLTVPPAVRDDVIACYKEVGEDRWEWAIKQWIGRGHRPQNIAGMMEVARHGFRDQRGGKHGERKDTELRYQDALREA